MKRSLPMLCALVLAISPVVGLQAAEPQQAFNPQPLIAAQKDAMAPLSFMAAISVSVYPRSWKMLSVSAPRRPADV